LSHYKAGVGYLSVNVCRFKVPNHSVLGIPYFCDWKPGRFRRTGLIRYMWFISYWACSHFLFL